MTVKTVRVEPTLQGVGGDIKCPRDKSFSHRAAMIGALSEGDTVIEGFSFCQDTWSTLSCLQLIGVEIETFPELEKVRVRSQGWAGLHEPFDILNVGNSGTTLRMLAGIAAGIEGLSIFTGDHSIRRRPMGRIIDPLRKTGIEIRGRDHDRLPPIYLFGKNRLHPIHHSLDIPSAQVKSCLLFAALRADGESSLEEPIVSRNHTENMLRSVGVRIEKKKNTIHVHPNSSLRAHSFHLPGDASSAAFLIAAALLIPGSRLVIRDMGLNPTRTGFLECVQRIGGNVERFGESEEFYEPRGNLTVEYSSLNNFHVTEDQIPSLIDEIPILAVLACRARGTSVISGAGELRVKESDRLHAISEGLSRLGANIIETEDGLIISGPVRLQGGKVKSYGDHRIAMSMVIAGLIADGPVEVEDIDCIPVSYPGFFDDLQNIGYRGFEVN